MLCTAFCVPRGFRSPRESGSASMTPRSPAGEALPFVPGVLSPRGSSSTFLGVLSPKGSWGGVDDAALVSGCRTALARRWSIRLIAANDAVRPMRADAAPRPLHSSLGTEEESGR